MGFSQEMKYPMNTKKVNSTESQHTPQRFGQLIGVKQECLDEYMKYHANVWPEIKHAIHVAGIRNYSIFHFQGQLFGYFEYIGPRNEFKQRMQTLAAAPRMREWWDIMEPMQIPVKGRTPGDWWANMQEVFHHD